MYPILALDAKAVSHSPFSLSGLPMITSYGKSRKVLGAPVLCVWSPCVVLCLQGPGPRRYRAMQVRHMCVCIVNSVRWYIVCKSVGGLPSVGLVLSLHSCCCVYGCKQSILLIYFLFEGYYVPPYFFIFFFIYLFFTWVYLLLAHGATGLPVSLNFFFSCNLKALCHFLLQWVYPILAHGA